MDNIECFERVGELCKFPEKLESNNAIAGLAVLIPLVSISSACIIGTFFAIGRRYYNLKERGFDEADSVLSIITLALSDIQLANSIAFSMSAILLQRIRSLSAYHYDMACNLGLAAAFTSAGFTSAGTMFSPVFSLKNKWKSAARFLLLLLSLSLLGHLLKNRYDRNDIFPGRTPSSDTHNVSSLVVQVSCFFNTEIPEECSFSTDRHAIPFLSDVFALIPLILIISIGFGNQMEWVESRNGVARFQPQIPFKSGIEINEYKRNFSKRRLLGELMPVFLSAVWTTIALWQCFDLRWWMNTSGWLKDDNERVVNSFGALFSFFSLLSLTLVLASSFDALHENKQRRRENVVEQRLAQNPPQLDRPVPNPDDELFINDAYSLEPMIAFAEDVNRRFR